MYTTGESQGGTTELVLNAGMVAQLPCQHFRQGTCILQRRHIAPEATWYWRTNNYH